MGMSSHWVPPTVLVGVYNAGDTLERDWAVFHQTKHVFTYDPATVLLGTYPREMKISHTKNNINAHYRLTCNGQKLRTTKMSLKGDWLKL